MASADNNLNPDFPLNSHKHPHYHLRLNKSVDRLLFIDIIKAFNVCFEINGYRYIGFGGPYLEDFKLLSNMFPAIKMISIESDDETFKRQKFHVCSTNLELTPGSFKDFLDKTEVFDKYPVIAWIDYTDNKIERFREIEALSKKAGINSLVRVTLRAQPVNIKAPAWLNKKFKKELKQICDEYSLGNINEEDFFQEASLSKIVCLLIEKAMRKGLDSDERVFKLLHKVRYSDGTQMVSVTGLIGDEDSDKIVEEMKSQCSYIDGNEIGVIDIPPLTLKERFHIEAYLPSKKKDGKTIAKILGYMIGKDGDDSLRKYEQYEKYYPYYPYFNKIIP